MVQGARINALGRRLEAGASRFEVEGALYFRFEAWPLAAGACPVTPGDGIGAKF